MIRGLNRRVWSPFPNLLTTASPSALGKKPAEEMEGFSKSLKPREKVQWLQPYQLQSKQGHIQLGAELTGWPSVLLWSPFP